MVSAAHPWFLLPLLCAFCCRFWLFFSASDCFSAGSPFLFSGFAALGWCSAPTVFHGLVLPQVPRPSCLPFFLLTVLRFCPVPSPPPLGSAASASAHGLSGVQYTASSSASGLLALSLSACSLVLLPSVCCSFRYLFCTSFSTFGFSFCRSFRFSLVASVAVSSDPQARVPPSWLRLSCLSPLMSFCCLRSSPEFWLFTVSSFSCTLCVVLPAQASLLRSFLSPGSSGVALPSPTLFLVRVSSSWWHLGVYFCLLSLPSLLLLLRLCWVVFILSTTLCWPCLPDFYFPFSSSWVSVPWACSYWVLFLGSVGSLSTARWLLVSSFWGFSSFRLCFFCRYAASSCVACSCRFSLILSLLLVSLPYWRLLWFAPSRGLRGML